MHLQANSRGSEPPRPNGDRSPGLCDCSLVHGLVAVKSRATVLVDANGRLLSCNAAATALLEARSAWSTNSKQLIVHHDPQVTAQLHASIRKLAADGAATSKCALFAPGADEERTLVTLTRIAGEQPVAACGQSGVTVLVSIFEGQSCRRAQDLDLLADVLALTHAEARLALALMDGLSLQTYSDQAGVRITTVRWHLRNALAKTGCANQRDFVRLIFSLTAD